jgi:hypothetical protein
VQENWELRDRNDELELAEGMGTKEYKYVKGLEAKLRGLREAHEKMERADEGERCQNFELSS